MDDEKIIELYWNRNQEAIVQTDQAYGRKLHMLAKNILQCYEDAEESVSDTYMKAWETIPPQRPKFFFAYLAKICRHFALGKLDWINAAKRKAEIVALTEEMELCIPDESRDAQMEGKEIGKAIDCFLDGLSLESRLIFMRRYWHCDTISQIAARYHISESKVKTQLHRLRAQLSVHLAKEGIYV